MILPVTFIEGVWELYRTEDDAHEVYVRGRINTAYSAG